VPGPWVVARVSRARRQQVLERSAGNRYLRGADHPYTTNGCIVNRIANGRVAESTAYINWLDPYVQLGLVDASNLTS
jgi:hypothetical protein